MISYQRQKIAQFSCSHYLISHQITDEYHVDRSQGMRKIKNIVDPSAKAKGKKDKAPD